MRSALSVVELHITGLLLFIVEISECKSTPCINGGTCEDLHHGTQYKCLCKPGFTGKNCEIGMVIRV